MTQDFIRRRIGRQTIDSCLARDELQPLMASYALSKRAGAVAAHVLRPFRMSIDFTDPAYCRVEGHTLVLLAESAVQQNRIRQLTPRLAAAAAAAGLPVPAVDARINPKRPAPQAGVAIPRIERAPSAVGAAAISGILDDIEDPALKATMERLRNVIKPGEENRRRLLEERLGRESIDLSTERMRLTTLVADLTHGINAAIIPTEEEARDYPRLEAERERKLELLAEQKDRRLVAVHRLERIDARLDAINRALELLAEQKDRRLVAEHRLERIDARLDAINPALELLPSDAQAAEAALVAPEDEEAPQAPPAAPRVSAAAAAAIASLARETPSPRMRKALMSHIPTLAPDEAHYPEALHAAIRREAERLSMLENPTPENTKRLAQLLEAAKALSERPQDARAIAEGLYGLT